MRFSKFQKPIFRWIENWSRVSSFSGGEIPLSEWFRVLGTSSEPPQKRHLKVEAVAGSGKTTTIVEAARFIPVSDRAIFLAYNKHIADELKKRLPPHVRASTTHSLGYRVCNSTDIRRAGAPDKNKTNNLLKEMQATFPERQVFPQVRKMVSAAKSIGLVPSNCKAYATGLTPDTLESWQEHVIERFNIEFEADEQQAMALDFARRILKLTIDKAHEVIDFDDMLYLPIVMKMPFPKFKWVIVDEAQDINIVQREIVKRIIASDGHVIAVGDSRQAIYGFRGADSASMENIRKELNADVLPLSVCYRCSKNVVREAKRIVPHIEYSDSAEEGSVSHALPPGTTLAYFTPDISVLCPFNAPLVEFAFKLLKERIAVRVLGKDLAGGVIKAIKKLNAANVADAIDKARDWFTEERSKIDPDDEDRQNALSDRYQVINVFLTEAAPNDSIETVIGVIESLFSEEVAPGILTLSTIHKAKGLEWDKVVLIDADMLHNTMRKGKPMPDWEIQQRVNLLYVGITRAKLDLVYVSMDELRRLN